MLRAPWVVLACVAPRATRAFQASRERLACKAPRATRVTKAFVAPRAKRAHPDPLV